MLDGLTDHDELVQQGVVKEGVIGQGRLLLRTLEVCSDCGDRVPDVAEALVFCPAHSGVAWVSASARMCSLSMSGVATSTSTPRTSLACRLNAARSSRVRPGSRSTSSSTLLVCW